TFIQNDPYAYSTLYRVTSRDRFRNWTPQADEYLLWKGLHQAGYLQNFANSFIILASGLKETLDKVIVNDFSFFSDTGRRAIYRTITEKPAGKDIIVKRPVWDKGDEKKSDGFFRQHLSKKKYLRGKLLSDLWLDAVFECRTPDTFEALLKSYYDFVRNSFQNSSSSTNLLDILPFNIIVDETGKYQTIDEEWIVQNSYPPEFIFFRALIWFGKTAGKLLKPLCDLIRIENIRGLVDYGFYTIGVEAKDRIEEFTLLEEALQTKVNFQKGLNNIRKMVEEPFPFQETESRPLIVSGQLFWADHRKEFSENRSVYAMAPMVNDHSTLSFPFFASNEALRWLKLKPINYPGYFTLENLLLKWTDSEWEKEKILVRFSNSREIADSAILENLVFSNTENGGIFLSAGSQPYLWIEVKEKTLADADIGKGYLSLEVEVIRPKGPEYRMAEKTLSRIRQLHEKDILRHILNQEKLLRTIEEKQRTIEEKQRTIEEKQRTIRIEQVAKYRHESSVRKLETEKKCLQSGLNEIRRSASWRG
ncbi:MAG: hypothetical protein AB1659_12945, partial [Thermodesulfobacteriota bacterium]